MDREEFEARLRQSLAGVQFFGIPAAELDEDIGLWVEDVFDEEC